MSPRFASSFRLLLAVAVFLVLGAAATPASAGRRIPIPFLINTGDVIYPVASMPENLSILLQIMAGEGEDVSGWKLGYRCKHFGFFGADFLCWDKELVVFENKTYAELPETIRNELSQTYPWSDSQRGFWKRYGVFLMGGGFLLLFGAGWVKETVSST